MTRKPPPRDARPRIRGKRISEEESLVAYRYGSIRILRDGRVRLSPRTVPGIPELDFSVYYGRDLGDGTYVHDAESPTICARWPGNPAIFMLSVHQGRVMDACFNLTLSADELRKAVDLLRRAGGGIERWLAPGLALTGRSLANSGNNPGTLKVIPALVESLRDVHRAASPSWDETPRRKPAKATPRKHARSVPRADSNRKRRNTR